MLSLKQASSILGYPGIIAKKAFWFLQEGLSPSDTGPDCVRVRYFNGEPNVGDRLSPYLVSKITGKRVVRVRSSARRHILAIGSVAHFASPNSTLWGSGIMHPTIVPRTRRASEVKICALRGSMTRDLLWARGFDVSDCCLGDPALLVPRFYHPKRDKKVRLGIVPHYIDKRMPVIEELVRGNGVAIIDVADRPELFVDKLLECENIISSSLHGLILADAFGIPNQWVSFSDNIAGGEFKFMDYYTTTDNNSPTNIGFKDGVRKERLNGLIAQVQDKAKVSNYIYDRNILLNSFPSSL